ncbi:RWD domain-containing protein [Calycina marina]|uniref:RBR-type E3 ubiquitin transferase n=1 Tax=Calycina marina TaxID=1763456 RepID=A0A9P8CH33_9HELO|nr:RWD domain-containing protein [Calycina marina]
MEEDNVRSVELECLAAIYPEIVLGAEPFTASLEIPVHPTKPVKVVFPASAEVAPLPTPPYSETDNEPGQATIAAHVESHNLMYLPSLHLHLTLPEGYPAEVPPIFRLSTTPQWLSQDQLDNLQAKGATIWEDNEHLEMVYDYVDSLQQAAENAFGCGEGKDFQIPQEHKISLLDYDIKAVQAAFEKETFDCGVCLDPKKGTVCHKMTGCGHVFCVECLQDFYNNAIKEGDLVSVRCLSPKCAKEREAQSPSKTGRKSKTQLSPSELLQIPLQHEVITRYVTLKHKADLESDKSTIYCPRKWCQGAARSKKHRKPEGFEVVESENESDTEETNGKVAKFKAGEDLLSVCEDCSFAFCSRCYQGWHGEFKSCGPRRSDGELTEEEKASLEYLKLHTTPCPTCAAPAQKTHGCNHMICFKCNSHFCYLCSSWLQPQNPYLHYNEENKPCFQRLWELEGGDGDDVGIGFFGVGEHVEEDDENEFIEEDDVGNDLANQPHHAVVQGDVFGLAPAEVVEQARLLAPREPAANRAPIEREGPLVLRINQLPRVAGPAALVAPAQANPGAAVPHPGRQNARAGQEARHRVRANNEAEGAVLDEANQAWVRMFVQMALNDEEDQLDSDDEGDNAIFDIHVR